MPWVKTVPPQQATGVQKEIYEGQIERSGSVSPATEIISLKPRYLALWEQLGRESRAEDWKLSRSQREMIAVVTSALCRCHF